MCHFSNFNCSLERLPQLFINSLEKSLEIKLFNSIKNYDQIHDGAVNLFEEYLNKPVLVYFRPKISFLPPKN